MFRRLLLQHPRRGVATGFLALTAFTLGSSDDPSLPTKFFARHFPTACPLPPPDSSKDVACCSGCLKRNSIFKAAAAAGPAVVNICLTEDVYGPMPIMGIGSGTIIDPDGTILTCADFSSRQVISKGKVILDHIFKFPGPYKGSLVYHPYSWTKVANIIFVDSPLGSGFSYSRKYEGYDANDTIWSEQASKFLLQWLVEHPQFISNPLYIAGDSYAGKIIPMVAKRILDGNSTFNLGGNLDLAIDLGIDLIVLERVVYLLFLARLSDDGNVEQMEDKVGPNKNVNQNNVQMPQAIDSLPLAEKDVVGAAIVLTGQWEGKEHKFLATTTASGGQQTFKGFSGEVLGKKSVATLETVASKAREVAFKFCAPKVKMNRDGGGFKNGTSPLELCTAFSKVEISQGTTFEIQNLNSF
ncbi:hypothetical protein ZIOFF_037063 [Zingiber officinale]|uniref:Uncharacterized protein n=1 Tax=Zingiber officinale TaxID=94328 RepID=A0A8J5L3V0_ZINOF|nr:hypothetical protein ZIOFF_037063 [Zingiber officinale]